MLDTSPSWDALSLNAVYYADAVLAPVSLEVLSVDGLASFQRRLEQVQRYREIPLRWIVPTALDRRVSRGAEILASLRQRYGEAVTDPIRYSSRVAEAPALGLTVFEHAPKDRAAEDYARLARKVIDGSK